MVPSMRKTPALVAAVVTFLALVAGMAASATGQADDPPARPTSTPTPLARPAGADQVQEDRLARHAGRLRHAAPSSTARSRARRSRSGSSSSSRSCPRAGRRSTRTRPTARAASTSRPRRTGTTRSSSMRVVVQAHPQGRAATPARAGLHGQPGLRARRAAPARGPGSRRATRSSSTRAPRCAGGSTPSTRPTASSPR